MRNFSQSISLNQVIRVTTVRASGWQITGVQGLSDFIDDVSNRLERTFMEHNVLDVSQEWLVEEVRDLITQVVAERNLGLTSQQCEEKIRDLRGHTPSEERVILALANFTADLLKEKMWARKQFFVYHNLNEGHCLLVQHMID